jgi:hypothetical protein
MTTEPYTRYDQIMIPNLKLLEERVSSLASQLLDVQKNLALKVLDDKIKLQSERSTESMKQLSTKVDASDFDSKWRELQICLSDFQKTSSVALASLEMAQGTFSANIAKSADATEVALLRGQVREATEAVNQKAEAGVVEQLSTQYRQLMASLQQKAEHVELETLRGRVTELKAIVLDKAEQNEVNRLSVKLEGLTQGVVATLDQKVQDLVPPAMEHHIAKIVADQQTMSLQLSECKSDNATLNDKMSEVALELSRKIDRDRSDALVAATRLEADLKQLEADLRHQAETATKEKLEIQKACSASIMQLTADVSGKAEQETVAAVASSKADKNLLEETVLALTQDMMAKIPSEVSFQVATIKGENRDLAKRVDEISMQVQTVSELTKTLARLDPEELSRMAQAQSLIEQSRARALWEEIQTTDPSRANIEQSRAKAPWEEIQTTDPSRAKAPLEERQTVDPSRAKAPLEETQTINPPRATSSLEQTQTLAPKRHLIPASLPACSNQVANWFRCLVELLVSATDPRSETDVSRVGGGFLYGSEVSLFDRRTRQGLLDILDSCAASAFALNLSAEETLANGRTLQILREESQPRAKSEFLEKFLEKKFDEIEKTIALKADVSEVSRLASMIQSFSDGTYGQALRTQQVVTRPTSARIGAHGRRDKPKFHY